MIALVGVDGVGKSTQAILLYKKLRGKFKIAVIHDEFPSLIVRVIWGASQRYKKEMNSIAVNERIKLTHFSLRKMLHVLLYGFNEVIILLRILNELRKHDIVILDRWFPDSLASVTYYKIAYMPIVKRYIRVLGKTAGFIMKFSNTKAFIILLKVEPSIAHMRRPEHSFSRQKIVNYLIQHFVGIIVKKDNWPLLVIDATNMNILEVHTTILEMLRRCLMSRVVNNE